MRAVQYDRTGAAEVLRLREIPAPRPKPAQALLRVLACSINPADLAARSGALPGFVTGFGFPRGSGIDLLGEVVALGEGAASGAAGGEPPAIGSRLWAYLGVRPGRPSGTAADLVNVPLRLAAGAPLKGDPIANAALPLVALTALQALRDTLRLGPGQRLLLIGGSGGVGTATIQIARILGATVEVVCHPTRAPGCLGLGAEAALDRDAFHPQDHAGRFDAVLHCGGPVGRGHRVLLRSGGRIASVAVAALPTMLDTAWRPGPTLRMPQTRPSAPDLALLAGWVDQGRLLPVVERIYALEEVVQAHRDMESEPTFGKRLLRVAHSAQPDPGQPGA